MTYFHEKFVKAKFIQNILFHEFFPPTNTLNQFDEFFHEQTCQIANLEK